MGVINVTPDSFSDGGKFIKPSAALALADRLVEEGAKILDIGGESSRPGADPVDEKQEVARVVPVIRSIVKRHPKIPVSIDTYKPGVAKVAIAEGAAIINDITGLTDPLMVELAATHNIPVVIMHMKGKPGTMQKSPTYRDVVSEIKSFFKKRIAACKKAGIKKIILDPGIGFGKTVKHNLAIINRLEQFSSLGYPVMVGASRKSFIGAILDNTPDEREEGTAAVTTLAVMKGASIIRVHNVARNFQAMVVAESIKDERPLN